MTVAEILEQVKALSQTEQDTLVIELLALHESAVTRKTQPKTGAEIVTMLNEMGPIELVDPQIEDPVEWVKAQRQKESDRLKAYWSDDK